MPKKTLPLTDAEVRNAKPKDKPYKLADGGGLYLEVLPMGGKSWRLKYRFGGTEKRMVFGLWPEVPLKRARQLREEARTLVAQGVDPGAKRKQDRAEAVARSEHTFEKVAKDWYDKNKEGWTANTARTNINRLTQDIFPALGARPINDITVPELLTVLRRVEERGAEETARRLRGLAMAVFSFAIASGIASHNPAAELKGALTKARPQHFASIRDPKGVGALLRDMDDYAGNAVVRAALRMAPYVFVRPGELRWAEWTEFDLFAAEWQIPASRMKMRVKHIVPLAKQVLGILEELRPLTGSGRFLFPSMRANSAPISDMTLLAALRRMGYGKDEMTVHGFRSMASTLLNEQGYNRDWIERQLAHGERDGVRAAYNYAQYLPERRRMMQEWSDYLDTLKASPKTSGLT